MININKTYAMIAGAALGGAAVSGVATYFITKKVLSDKYDATTKKTIARLTEDYEHKLAIANGEIEDDDVEEDVDAEAEADGGEEEESEDDDEESDGRSPRQHINYSKFSKDIKPTKMPKDFKEGVKNLLTIDDIDLDEELEPPLEIIKRPRPFLIRKDQEDECPWYDSKEISVFLSDYIFIAGEKVSIPIIYSLLQGCSNLRSSIIYPSFF